MLEDQIHKERRIKKDVRKQHEIKLICSNIFRRIDFVFLKITFAPPISHILLLFVRYLKCFFLSTIGGHFNRII